MENQQSSTILPHVRAGFNFQEFSARLIDIVKNPKECWDRIAAEEGREKDLLVRYFIPCALCLVVGQVFSWSIYGLGGLGIIYRVPFFSALISSILYAALSLVMLFVLSWIASTIAPKFGGSGNSLNAFKLLGFAYAPAWASNILYVIPYLGLITIFFALYSIYIFFMGIPKMLGVSPDRRLAFFIVFLVLGFVASLLISFVAGPTIPMPEHGTINISGEMPLELQRFADDLAQAAASGQQGR